MSQRELFDDAELRHMRRQQAQAEWEAASGAFRRHLEAQALEQLDRIEPQHRPPDAISLDDWCDRRKT